MSSALVKSRLNLESLEAREVPANFFWLGGAAAGATDPTIPANWGDTVLPGANDVLIFGPVSSSSEGGGGFGEEGPPASPPPPPPPLYDCTGITSASDSFAGIQILTGYTKTVTLGETLTVGTFSMADGAIAQTIPNSSLTADLTVTNSFIWTDGVLNSSSALANVNVQSDGVIAPVNAGTVSLGSNLIMTGIQPSPKTVTMNSGTVNVTKAGLAVVIGAYSNFSANVSATNVVGITKPSYATGAYIVVESNGKLTVTGPGTFSTNLEVTNYGEFTLQGSVNAFLTDTGASYEQNGSSSALRIQNGSYLYVSGFARVDDGIVFIMMNSNLTASQQTATIDGNFKMAGGMIFFDSPITIATALTYGTFTVNGNVDWSGGTYKPSVDYTTAGLANKWIVNGEMKSKATCVVDPNPQRGATPPATSLWLVLEATTTAGTIPPVTGNTLTLE